MHFHGNFGNLSNHFPLALFLVEQGFDVLSFDYEGYGASEGHPTPARTIADGIASVRYAKSRLRTPGTGVGVFGQSLGGAVAIVVAAQEPAVRGAVIESAFSGYRAMGADVLKRHIWTWPFMVAIPFLGAADDPQRMIGRISPRPVFLIHGDQDSIVPLRMSEILLARAKDPKELWVVPGAGHLLCHRVARSAYERRVTDFFDRILAHQ